MPSVPQNPSAVYKLDIIFLTTILKATSSTFDVLLHSVPEGFNESGCSTVEHLLTESPLWLSWLVLVRKTARREAIDS